MGPDAVSIADGDLVTNDNADKQSHDVSPDGRWIMYATDLGHPGNFDLYRRRRRAVNRAQGAKCPVQRDSAGHGVNTCLGENFHAYGEVPYRMHEVSNAAGGYSYHAQLLPITPRGLQFTWTGLTSGTVWRLKNGQADNESFVINPSPIPDPGWGSGTEGSGLQSNGCNDLMLRSALQFIVPRGTRKPHST